MMPFTREAHLPLAKRARAAKLEVTEREDAYEVKIETPGVRKTDLSIELSDNVLTIKGETRQATEAAPEAEAAPAEAVTEAAPEAAEETDKPKAPSRRTHRQERFHSSFQRAVRLPRDASSDASAVVASYADGVLSIEVPKAQPSSAVIAIN